MPATIPTFMERAPGTSAIAGRFPIALNWLQWVNALVLWVNRAAVKTGEGVTLTEQGASIGATALPTGTLEAGIYRVTYYARITRAATTSSSLTVTVGFTDGGVSCTLSGSAITGNTTASTGTGSFLVQIDAGTAITYATTYASVGGTSMQYAVLVRLEKLP